MMIFFKVYTKGYIIYFSTYISCVEINFIYFKKKALIISILNNVLMFVEVSKKISMVKLLTIHSL